MDGKIGGIEGGVDRCILSHWEVDEKTKKMINYYESDARHLSEIKTDDMGLIKIIKKTTRNPARKWAAQVMKKIDKMSGQVTIDIA